MSKVLPDFKLPAGIPSGDRIEVDSSLLERIQALYDSAQYVTAWELAREAGPFQRWRGAAAQVLGYRLCGNIGAPRTAALLICRARREHPRNPQVAVHFGYYLHERRGPLATWHNAAKLESLAAPSRGQRADFLAQKARVASQFRDFDCAWKLIREAEEIYPGSAWLATERSGILQMQESHDEALEALGEALSLRSWFRPAVQRRARVLHLLGRLEEAVAFLTEAMERIECGAVALQLWQFRRERDDEEEMLELLDRIEGLTPEPEPDFVEWIAAKRADALYLGGAHSAAATEAGKVTGAYYRQFADRLLSLDRPGKRVRLPFTFVLQGHNTCGPATLAAIAAYWGGVIPQHDIVAAIAYDGTHDHSERRWCEENGFAATEFTVTWDAARRLIDAGIPFALATVEVESAHLQAVIGYDEVRETLFIQDPGEPNYRETTAREFLDEYVLTGPRGMAIVPPQRREEVAALDLPDVAVYTRHHEFASALARYDRESAATILDGLESEVAGHRLTRFARFSLAAFDGNSLEREKCIADFLAEYPENPRVIHWRLQFLRESGRFEDRIALLRGTVDKPGSHPIFLRELAAELASDGRQSREAQRFLRRAHRVFPADSSVLVELADLLWRDSRDPGLLDYYRFAAARSDKHEGFARRWFFAARLHGRDGEVLDWLSWRFSAYGDRSGAPAITLADCLDHLSRTDEALRLLDDAISRRPEDGELLVYTARLAIRYGLVERGREHLARARGRCHDGTWLRALATLHQRLGETGEALATWQRVLEREPLAVDGHRAVAHHLSLLVGESAARTHLKEACERFPHHAGLAEIRLARLCEDQPEEALGVARQLVAILPANAWARRELAILLEKTGRLEEALVEAKDALAIAPRDPASHGVAATLLIKAGRHEEASKLLRTSIALDVNYGWAVDGLVSLQRSTGEKRDVLDLVRAEMVRQVLDGNMLHSYRSTAFSVVDPAELLEQLREVWEARPDLWESWSVLAAQTLDTGDEEEALRLSQKATELFPLLPGAWRDLAQIHRLRGERDEAITAIRRAVELNPDWELAWRVEADYLEETGRPEEAIATLERAVRRLPNEGAPRALLATMLWRAGRPDEAWEVGSKLVVEDPGFGFVWDQIGQWASVMGRRDEVVRLARQVAADRPGEARSWMILAKALPLAEVAGELEAYAKAIELNPRLEEAYDLKAVALARSGRIDEAARCLRSGPWGGHLPAALEGRLASLESVRGDPAKALAEMSSVLERNSDYYWGWERCAEWAEATGDREAWRRAVRELIRLAPRDAEPIFHAASVEEELGNRDEAIALLRRALQLDPAHAGAAGRLVVLLWEKRDREGLASVPAGMLDAGPTRAIARAALAFSAALKRDYHGAEEWLERAVTEPELMGEVASTLDEVFRKEQPQRLRRAYLRAVEMAVRENRIGPSFARLWVVNQTGKGRWEIWTRFRPWIDRLGERAMPAISDYIDAIGKAKKASVSLPQILRLHGEWFRGHTRLWGKVGYALANSDLHVECCEWLADAPERADTEGWILANLASSLRHLGRDGEAIAASREAVERGLQDHTWSWHVPLAAYGEALAGNAAAARDLHSRLGEVEIPDSFRVMNRLTSALCAVLEAPDASSSKRAYRTEVSRLRQELPGMIKPDARLKRHYSDTVASMARRTRCWVPWWRRTWPGQLGNVVTWIVVAITLVFYLIAVLGRQE